MFILEWIGEIKKKWWKFGETTCFILKIELGRLTPIQTTNQNQKSYEIEIYSLEITKSLIYMKPNHYIKVSRSTFKTNKQQGTTNSLKHNKN